MPSSGCNTLYNKIAVVIPTLHEGTISREKERAGPSWYLFLRARKLAQKPAQNYCHYSSIRIFGDKHKIFCPILTVVSIKLSVSGTVSTRELLPTMSYPWKTHHDTALSDCLSQPHLWNQGRAGDLGHSGHHCPTRVPPAFWYLIAPQLLTCTDVSNEKAGQILEGS